ncbi:hypothetical protein PATSB16_09320 [Pandoraea thiooxydans]|uniref:YXWGXW repeat-containing protein n=1 Tax=Pandoraea thiooxydans TaxID=445709 RepID=A0A0G3EWB9_9BURK|nr:YXWGXW repeat-containing protein [Pandoraea thiooxydans]AKJ70314.2 hypothetical protein ABW99_02535 [Pandoraea thiooxydans]APR94274.1 hypothetical protein PATSB16_09320 [Pandoraea thiooxydans]
MNVTWFFMAAAISLAAALFSPASSARPQANVTVMIDRAPPPPVYERMPPPRRGYVWSPGYWRWTGHRHIWVNGQWVRARRGYRYQPPHWVRDGREWRFSPGDWRR